MKTACGEEGRRPCLKESISLKVMVKKTGNQGHGRGRKKMKAGLSWEEVSCRTKLIIKDNQIATWLW